MSGKYFHRHQHFSPPNLFVWLAVGKSGFGESVTTRLRQSVTTRLRQAVTTRLRQPATTRPRQPVTIGLRQPVTTRPRQPVTTRLRQSVTTRLRQNGFAEYTTSSRNVQWLLKYSCVQQRCRFPCYCCREAPGIFMLPEIGQNPVILCLRVGSITRKYCGSWDQNFACVEQTRPSPGDRKVMNGSPQ
jgi:hypothetical protein